MAEMALVRVIQPRRECDSYFLAGDDIQVGFVENERWLDAQFADRDWAGSKLSKNMGRPGCDESDDPMGEDHVVGTFINRGTAVCINSRRQIQRNDCSRCVIDDLDRSLSQSV